jgi:hypothetical protein
MMMDLGAAGRGSEVVDQRISKPDFSWLFGTTQRVVV